MDREPNEPVLEDDYPIYFNYYYLADGKVVTSEWDGITARELKTRLGAQEIRRCDFVARKLKPNAWHSSIKLR